jgi:hypothetical protein
MQDSEMSFVPPLPKMSSVPNKPLKPSLSPDGEALTALEIEYIRGANQSRATDVMIMGEFNEWVPEFMNGEQAG